MATRQQAEDRVEMAFFIHLGVYVFVAGGLMVLNLMRNPDRMWSLWVAGGWGAGVILHAALQYLSPRAQNRAIERIERRLQRGWHRSARA